MFLRYLNIGFKALCVYAYGITAIATFQVWGIPGLAIHLAVAICLGFYIRLREISGPAPFKVSKIQK